MSDVVEMQLPAPEETIAHLRAVIRTLTGFLLGEAGENAMSPEEAARRLLAVFPAGRAQPSPATAPEVEQEVRAFTRVMAMIHGHVAVERTGEVWTLRTSVGADRSEFERWGASIADWHHFVLEQERRRGHRLGIEVDGWLEDETFCLRLAPARTT